jgi:hypothetical protein
LSIWCSVSVMLRSLYYPCRSTHTNLQECVTRFLLCHSLLTARSLRPLFSLLAFVDSNFLVHPLSRHCLARRLCLCRHLGVLPGK